MDTIIKKQWSWLCSLLLFCSFNCNLCAEELSLGDRFQPAESGCEFVWQNDHSKLPETVPHYTAGDHRFSQKFIQYFKELGKFTPESRVAPLEHWVTRNDSEIYETESRNLNISPVTGSMIYCYQQDSNKRSLNEAPTVEEAREMTKNLLTKLEFDLGAVAFEGVQFTSGTATRFDRTLGKVVKTRSSTGMFLPRLYEGNRSTHGGVRIDFQLGAELTNFSICWRDVEVAGKRRVPSREEIAKQILEGRSTVMMDAAQNANKLTVKKISVIYREAEPFKKADTVEPYLLIKADAEANGVTADCTIYLKLQ